MILDHYHAPRNNKPLSLFDAETHIDNPFCGDEIDIQVKMNGKQLEAISVSGIGCSISQASGSMMSEFVQGKPLTEIRKISELFAWAMEHGAPSSDKLVTIGNLTALIPVRQFPVRVKCALLAWYGLDNLI